MRVSAILRQQHRDVVVEGAGGGITRGLRRQAILCRLYRVSAGLAVRSRENLNPGADAVSSAEGNTNRRIIASAWSTRRGRRAWHV